MEIQVKKESAKAYVEVLETIKYMKPELVQKIPPKLIQFFKDYKDENYQFKFDENTNIENQKISLEAGSILAILMLNYIADEKEKLTKQYIRTGGTVWGYVEIKQGLSTDDQIAFPYGKSVREGAAVKLANEDE